jgi:uncharacterized protein (TIGR02145 family)
MKKSIFLSIILALSTLALNAQVLTNGAARSEIEGSNVLIDGSTAYSAAAGANNNLGKGIVIPSVDLVNFEFNLTFADGVTFPTYFDGMIVYNRSTGTTLTTGARSSTATEVKPGYYYFYNPDGATAQNVTGGVWKAISYCDGDGSGGGGGGDFDPTGKTPNGVGSFGGRTCFDVAQVNDGGECGTLSKRQSETLTATSARADFSNALTNTQTYTFTPSSAVSNIRFYAVESPNYTGQIIESVTPQANYSGTNISTAASVTIVYKNVNSLASGKTSSDALTVDIYAVYDNNPAGGGTDKVLKLSVTIQDCPCCGAYTAAGTWLNFMCYNLGADPTLATPADQQNADMYLNWRNNDGLYTSRVLGNFYQWGKKLAYDAELLSAGGLGWISLQNLWSGNATAGAYTAGWNSNNAAWGAGTVKNSEYDPCPSGWRVPSAAQWKSILNGISEYIYFIDQETGELIGDVMTTAGNLLSYKEIIGLASTPVPGLQIGDYLFLPAMGYRGNTMNTAAASLWGPAPDEGSGTAEGAYWSSNTATVSSQAATHAVPFAFNANGVGIQYETSGYGSSGYHRSTGLPIRCVADY